MANIFCGVGNVPKNKKLGTFRECAEKKQIRRYGLIKIDPKELEALSNKELIPVTDNKLKKELSALRGTINRNKGRYEKTKNMEEKGNYYKLWKDAESRAKKISAQLQKVEKVSKKVSPKPKKKKVSRKPINRVLETKIKQLKKLAQPNKQFEEKKREQVSRAEDIMTNIQDKLDEIKKQDKKLKTIAKKIKVIKPKKTTKPKKATKSKPKSLERLEKLERHYKKNNDEALKALDKNKIEIYKKFAEKANNYKFKIEEEKEKLGIKQEKEKKQKTKKNKDKKLQELEDALADAIERQEEAEEELEELEEEGGRDVGMYIRSTQGELDKAEEDIEKAEEAIKAYKAKMKK